MPAYRVNQHVRYKPVGGERYSLDSAIKAVS